MIRKSRNRAPRPARRKGEAGDAPEASRAPVAVLPPLSEQTIGMVRRDFPGLDVYAIKGEYDSWLADDSSRMPKDYQKGFYGFVRHVHARYHA